MIGGNGFIGPAVVERLLTLGHDVTLFHRGAKKIFTELNHITGDRRQIADYAAGFRSLAPDVVLDLILSNGRQAQELMRTFKGITQRVVALSSMDVYRIEGRCAAADQIADLSATGNPAAQKHLYVGGRRV